MICPLTRIASGSSAGATCKESCAWWDTKKKRCIITTLVETVVALREDVKKLANPIVEVKPDGN